MYTLYSLITALGMILLTPYFLVRGLITGKYLDQIVERMGWRFPPELMRRSAAPDDRSIWIHAVSVGEVLAVMPLARLIKQRYPDRRLVISTTTKTGQRLARGQKDVADAVFYFPLDWNGPLQRVMAVVRPAAVLVVETEIWPNFLRLMNRSGVPVIFVNGRLSEKSFRGYQRAFAYSGGTLRGFLRRVLNDATVYLMQSEADGSRLLELGAGAERVIVTGNLKYDMGMPPPTAFSEWLGEALSQTQHHPVIVAGSVVAGEEAAVIQACAILRKRFPRALLVLAPRKPERFDAAAKIAQAAGEKVVRRRGLTSSANVAAALRDEIGILLLDSVGELAAIYALADVTFVGGSLVPSGGHNILEPAAFGKAPIFGPSMENFREMAQRFRKAGAAIQVQDPASLADAWMDLLRNKEKAAQMGDAARMQIEQNRGATVRAMAHIEKFIGKATDQSVAEPRSPA